jgi:hypothetical protein
MVMRPWADSPVNGISSGHRPPLQVKLDKFPLRTGEGDYWLDCSGIEIRTPSEGVQINAADF